MVIGDYLSHYEVKHSKLEQIPVKASEKARKWK